MRENTHLHRFVELGEGEIKAMRKNKRRVFISEKSRLGCRGLNGEKRETEWEIIIGIVSIGERIINEKNEKRCTER